MYPNSINNKENDYSLQSRLFGHRMKDNQTLYEYLIEFLQVMISPKEVTGMSKQYKDYFPIDDLIEKRGLSFSPVTRIGLKRFVFLPKSKLESKAEVDELAYNDCITGLKESMLLDSSLPFDKDFYVIVLQNLLLGFKAVNQNRSWFDQNLLPICCEVILPESMGLKSKRKDITYRPDQAKVDNEFSYDRYTYMRRGGEVYYLHLLQSLEQNPGYKDSLEEKFQNLVNQFPQFSLLTTFIQLTWERRLNIEPHEKKLVTKVLGAIPQGFAKKGKYTLTELDNFLDTAIHPFEKIDILSHGIILQILRMMYHEAAEIAGGGDSVWIIDVNEKGLENKEVRKLAINGFDSNEECINTALHKGFEAYKSDLIKKSADNEFDIIKKAAADTFKLYRKLGKTIGLVIPPKGIGIRFSLSEKVIKFLVLSIIPPKGKVTLDTFINKLYEHYGMIIDRVQYKVEMHKGNVQHLNNLSFLESNKDAFAQKLKDCGFLRDLSDSTSIVENPYGRECQD